MSLTLRRTVLYRLLKLGGTRDPYFALLQPSELMEIVFDNLQAWHNEPHWRKALRMCEGSSP